MQFGFKLYGATNTTGPGIFGFNVRPATKPNSRFVGPACICTIIQAGPGKKLLENLKGCISTTSELRLAKTRVAIDVSINYTLTKLLVPKMHVF